MKVCDCNASLGNTGTPQCKTIESVAVGLIYVPLTDRTGTKNFIDLTVALDQAFWDGKVNETDPFKRFYPSPRLEAVEDIRADSIFETLPSGRNIKVQDGTRAFKGAHVRESTTFLDIIKQNGCSEFSAFVIDKNGALIGNGATVDKFFPIRIDENTFDPQLIKTTDTTVQKIMINFEWDQTESDSDLRQINATEVGIDLTQLRGLLDVVVSPVGVTGIATGGLFTMPLELKYGTAKDKINFTGAVAADFTLTDDSDDSDVVIDTVTENPVGSGVYDFVAAAGANKTVFVTLARNGFDGVTIPATKIILPV